MIKADWIVPEKDMGDVCPVFQKKFEIKKELKKAILRASARGVYEAKLNGERVGSFILAPGWTEYETRIQLQEYDITDMVKSQNELNIQLANGWYLGRISTKERRMNPERVALRQAAIIAEIELIYEDGERELIGTDESWACSESALKYCDFYDGIIYDATFTPDFSGRAAISKFNDTSVLIAQQGDEIREITRLKPTVIHTPKGETVLDFGQDIAGYLEIAVNATAGDLLKFSFGEILDKDGNFYNQNYRTARALYEYTCKDGYQVFRPTLTFYGFRYVRVDECPFEIKAEDFTAVVVHSDMERTGFIETSDPLLQQLYSNVVWGQRSCFIDVPVDCPQRDERLGWSGDAQVYCPTGVYNFNSLKFYRKWLEDIKIAQLPDGQITSVIPNVKPFNTYGYTYEGVCGGIAGGVGGGAAWGDIITVLPWQLYTVYGDVGALSTSFDAMKKWVDYITASTTKENLWFGGRHYGDWLELKANYGDYKGATRDDLIASAYYAYGAQTVCKAGKILGEDVSKYEVLYKKIVAAYQSEFNDTFHTQTEHVLTLLFDLAIDKEKVFKSLVDMIHADGDRLQTGFVGTPHLLEVLKSGGEIDLVFKLLLREEYPSWLYEVKMGATTAWEHWDSIMPDGKLWPVEMNSFNHYAYGSIGAFLYRGVSGINTVEQAPGFENILFTPIATDKIDRFYAELKTIHGKIRSGWHHENGKTVYEITTPRPATAVIGGREYKLAPGFHTFEI